MSSDFIKNSLAGLLISISLLLVGCTSQPRFMEAPGAWNTLDQMPPPSRVEREYNVALKAITDGNDEQAIQRLEVFIVENPRWPGAYVNLAILYDRHDRAADALGVLDQALSVAPEFVPALNQIGVIRRKQGDFLGAEEAWVSATKINPEYAYAWYNLGVLYELYRQDLPVALE